MCVVHQQSPAISNIQLRVNSHNNSYLTFSQRFKLLFHVNSQSKMGTWVHLWSFCVPFMMPKRSIFPVVSWHKLTSKNNVDFVD